MLMGNLLQVLVVTGYVVRCCLNIFYVIFMKKKYEIQNVFFFFFSSRRRHTRYWRDWSSDVCSSDLIRRIFTAATQLHDAVRVIYLENYEMDLGHLMTSGADLWLNNPLRPLEASGTSGMKAALNAVPSLSVLDGWWVEGCVEGTTGWAIGADAKSPQDAAADSPDMYYKLERIILPMFYGLPYSYAQVMRNAIALNGSFFNTQRMVTQYVQNAYFP